MVPLPRLIRLWLFTGIQEEPVHSFEDVTTIFMLLLCSMMSNGRIMIVSWKHKGLKLFFETGSTRGIQAEHADKLRRRLLLLNCAKDVSELNFPGFGLHRLIGKRKTIWSIRVSGNWRLTFEFNNEDVYVLNYEDYQ